MNVRLALGVAAIVAGSLMFVNVLHVASLHVGVGIIVVLLGILAII